MILDKFKLDGKVAMVTGARTGLGQSIAIALAQAGADIIGLGRSAMLETEKAVTNLGRKFLFIDADLMTIEPVGRVVEEAIQEFGQIDILVNNAGVIRRSETIDFSEKDWDDVMNVNLKSVFFLSQAVAKEFIKREKGGKIINLASVLSFHAAARCVSYTASKFAVVGMTKEMSNSWAKYGINCNAIAPGYHKIDMTAPLRENPDTNSALLSKIPAGRYGDPDDLKGVAILLASEASDYIMGETICVDGGWLAK